MMKMKIGVLMVLLVLQQFSAPTQGASLYDEEDEGDYEMEPSDSVRELWEEEPSYEPQAKAVCSNAATWISLFEQIATLTNAIRYSKTLTYDLPREVPSIAKEVLLFVSFDNGWSKANVRTYYKIYTIEGPSCYAKYVSMHTYQQNAWNTNSENMWLPVTSNRKVYVAKQGTTDLTGNVYFAMHVIGYR